MLDRPDIQIISKHLITSHGTTQLRCVQPAAALRTAGYSVSVQTIYRTTPIAQKLIILHRVVLDEYTRHFITCAQARGVPLIYDTDDLLFDPEGIYYLSRGAKAQNYTNGWKPYANAMAMCDAVSVSTDFLAKRARNVNPNAHVILNALSEDYLKTADDIAIRRKQVKRKNITLAYLSGSHSHDNDFATIERALVRVLCKHPSTRLLLVGPLEISQKFAGLNDRIIRQNFQPYADFPTIFKEIDINLIPLETDQAFCHAKSELKFIEAGACGVASVASPTDPHKATIKHGENGMLATNDWESCLDTLIEDSDLRERLGDSARRHVKARYTPEQCAEVWEKVIPLVIENYDAKSVERHRYLMSLITMTLKFWRRALRQWVSKQREIWLINVESNSLGRKSQQND